MAKHICFYNPEANRILQKIIKGKKLFFLGRYFAKFVRLIRIKSMSINIEDKPLKHIHDDKFDFMEKFLNPISNYIKDNTNTSVTVIVSGEWGSGKSTSLNLLKEKLLEGNFLNNEKIIIINFEPLIEAKLEVYELIELFYFKLYKKLKELNSDVEIIKNCLKSFIILAKQFKFDAALKLGGTGIGVSYDLNGAIDEMIDFLGKDEINDFSEQTKMLNKSLFSKYKVFIFIDEIDRLPAKHIINFLLFSRVLEEFEKLVCLIGVDYDKVLYKLTNEPESACFKDISGARDYLDKFFQQKYQITHTIDEKINYFEHLIDKAGVAHFFQNLEYKDFKEIICYLNTPRRMVKFVMVIQSKKTFFRNFLEIINKDIFYIIAVTVKNPDFLDFLPKIFQDEEGVDNNFQGANRFRIKIDLFLKEDTGLNDKDKKFIEQYQYHSMHVLFIYVSGQENEQIMNCTKNLICGLAADANKNLDIIYEKDKKFVDSINEMIFPFTPKLNKNREIKIQKINYIFEKFYKDDLVSMKHPSMNWMYLFITDLSIEDAIASLNLELLTEYVDIILNFVGEKEIDNNHDINRSKEIAESYGMDLIMFSGKYIYQFTEDDLKKFLHKIVEHIEEFNVNSSSKCKEFLDAKVSRYKRRANEKQYELEERFDPAIR